MGYPSSTASMLAMERGEVEGHSTSLEVVRATHPDWLPEKKITPLVQYALKRHPELPDVPMSWELGRNDEERQILRIVANATEVGKMILSTPDTPADRITGAAPRLRRHHEGPGLHGRAEGAARRARADAGRGIAEARGRGRHRVAGDHRQGQGDLSAELTRDCHASDRLRVALAVVSLLLPAAAAAQSVADFYRGKTVSLILGYPGGGSNGIYARAVARHIGRHIPGNPNVIFRTMPGAGSLVAANHLFHVAPKDGTALGLHLGDHPARGIAGRRAASNSNRPNSTGSAASRPA